MSTTFVSRAFPDAAHTLESLHAANPFCTQAYGQAMAAVGSEPRVIGVESRGQLTAGCYGFLSAGRLNRVLYIPAAHDGLGDSFWTGLRGFCAQEKVSGLSISGYAAEGLTIPHLPGETARTRLLEYAMTLDPAWESRIFAKHWQRIRKARRLRLQLRTSQHPAACRDHAVLMDASMHRRIDRGESVAYNPTQEAAWTLEAIRTGAGQLFQAFLADRPLSSLLVLRSSQGAYNCSGGTSPEGMTCGASHFLIHATAEVLHRESIRVFYLGAIESDPGLMEFKSRFGATCLVTDNLQCYFGSRTRRALTGVARRIRATLLSPKPSGCLPDH